MRAAVKRLEASLTGGTSDETSDAIAIVKYVAVFWCSSNGRHAFVASPPTRCLAYAPLARRSHLAIRGLYVALKATAVLIIAFRLLFIVSLMA